MGYHYVLDYMKGIFSAATARLSEFLPHLIGAIAIILMGHLMARLFASLAKRLLKKVAKWVPNPTIQSHLQPSRTEPSALLIGRVIYWITLFFAITIATEVMGLPVLSTWLGGIAGYLPKILVSVLIVICGIIGGVVLRDIIVSAAQSAGLRYGAVLGTMAQYIVAVVTLLIAMDHVGIEITFLIGIIMVLLGAAFLGSALAFGLGAKTFVNNILAVYYLQKIYKVGQMVRVGEFQGKIVRIGTIAVFLDTSEGEVWVPAKQFIEMTSLLLKEDV